MGEKGIPYLISYTPINTYSRQINRPKCESKTVKLLDNNTEEYLCALKTGILT